MTRLSRIGWLQFGLVLGTLLPTYPQQLVAQDLCQLIEGASIIANDGEYLGKLTSSYDSESIFNQYGSYGSPYSSTSIWNEYGQYGGEYSALSPFNPYTSTPPSMVKDGEVVGYLTVNRVKYGAVSPPAVRSCEFA